MALTDKDKEIIAEIVHESQKFSPKTKLNELLLQSGITLLGLGILSFFISVIAWGIIWIWNHILA